MDCFAGCKKKDGRTEVIQPEGPAPKETEVITMLPGEENFGFGPLAMASYPATAMRMPKFDEAGLKKSLSKALQEVPVAAGRFCTMILNGAGVPFTVVAAAEKSAPTRLEEEMFLKFTDWPRPAAVFKGQAPAMTVKLTTFQDGSAVLCVCRSHMMFDGGSSWAFLNYWAALARGEAPKAPKWRKDEVFPLIPSEDATKEMLTKFLGRPPTLGVLGDYAIKSIFAVVAPIYDLCTLTLGTGLHRDRLFFSDQEMAAIKAAATPTQVAPGQDNWVTTQEAFTAYLLYTLGHELLPAESSGDGKVVFFLDARKSAGLPADQLMGNGLVVMVTKVPKFMSLSLSEIACSLHETFITGATSPQKVQSQWQMMMGANKLKAGTQVYQEVFRNKGCDLELQINNSSKRQLPDFGTGCESVITNAGPTLFLPAKGGMEVLFHSSTFSSTGCSSAAKQKALAALRSKLPKGK
ncbi:unnamed protein product [Effrenium voratum]|nr:unnamed protein product [Effrenium voratum]